MNAPFAHQATCVSVAGRGLMIVGPPGSGKSSLALMLIDRGAKLVGDDSVMLNGSGPQLMAAPHPNTAGLIEVRNVGLVTIPAAQAPVCLVLTLSENAPRFIDHAGEIELAGHRLPLLHFRTGDAAAAIRAEWALSQFGLSLAPPPPSL